MREGRESSGHLKPDMGTDASKGMAWRGRGRRKANTGVSPLQALAPGGPDP